MSEIFRQRNAPRIVGVSILLMLALVLTAVAMLLHKNNVFSKHDVYYLLVEQSELRGIRESMDIQILGESIGAVTNLDYVGNSNQVQLTLKIKSDEDSLHNAVWENSRIVVSRSLGIGNAYLEIERGTDNLGAIVSNTSERDVVIMRAAGESARGVKIEQLSNGSPAEKAGLEVGQILTQFNGKQLESINDLYEAMATTAPGDEIALRVYQYAQPVKVIAELVEPKRLAPGGVIIQFQPEFDTFKFLGDRLALVQESISNVERNIVDTLNKTEADIDNDLKPTIAQYLETGKSLQSTSDTLRQDTLVRFAKTLEGVDESSTAFTSEISSIGKQLGELTEDRINPSLGAFTEASNSLTKTSKTLATTTEQVGEDITLLVEELRETTAALNKVLASSQNVVNALETESQNLPGTLNGINDAVDKAGTLIDGVSNHWILRRSVQKSKEAKGQPVSTSSRRTRPLRNLLQKRN